MSDLNPCADDPVMEIMVDVPAVDLDSEEHKLEVLQDIQDEIAATGGVNHALAISLESLMTGSVSSRMPLASFTRTHSRTNYAVTMEALSDVAAYVKTNILAKVIEAIKKLIEWIASLFGRGSGGGDDVPQKEQIAQNVKKSVKNERRVQQETKREAEIAKRISRVDSLSTAMVEAVKKDMASEADFNSTGSDVAKVFEDARAHFAVTGLRGKFSPFIYQLIVKSDGDDLIKAGQLQSLLTEHISLVVIEIGALTKAMDNGTEFPPRNGFLPYERYNKIFSSFKHIKYTVLPDTGFPTLAGFKKEVHAYIAPDDTIKVNNFAELQWKGAAVYFEGASQRLGEKFITQVLHVNNLITKISEELTKKHDDATVGKYLPAIQMIKDEIAYITHVSSIIDMLEVACGNFSSHYNRQVLRASHYFTKAFMLRLKKMEGVDNELRDRITEYVNTGDGSEEALESVLISLDYSYLRGLRNTESFGIENFLDKVTDAVAELIVKSFTSLYDLLKGAVTEQEAAIKKGKQNVALLGKNISRLEAIGKLYDNRDTQREVITAVKRLGTGKNAANELLAALLKPESVVYVRLLEERNSDQQDLLFSPALALQDDYNFTDVLKIALKTDGATAANRSLIDNMLAKENKNLVNTLLAFTCYHRDGRKYDVSEIFDDKTLIFKAVKENMEFLLSPADEYYRIPDIKTFVGFTLHLSDFYNPLTVHVGNMKKALANVAKWEDMLSKIPPDTKLSKETTSKLKEFVHGYAILVKSGIFIIDSLLAFTGNITEALLNNSNAVIDACKDL